MYTRQKPFEHAIPLSLVEKPLTPPPTLQSYEVLVYRRATRNGSWIEKRSSLADRIYVDELEVVWLCDCVFVRRILNFYGDITSKDKCLI